MPLLACNIDAIAVTDRPRYNDLVRRLRFAMHDRSELADGYSYSLRLEKITLPEVAEWITMERLCCPFLSFQLGVAGEVFCLMMRGPNGTKAILREEFFGG